jgi:hypothetical protein
VEITADGVFRPQERSILAGGPSYVEIAQLCELYNIPILLCIDPHGQGDSTGTGYHNAGGHGRRPRLNPTKAGNFASTCFAYFPNVVAYQFGNELDYAPSEYGNWAGYLEDCWVCALEVRAAAPPDPQEICGGQHLEDKHKGRTTIHKAFHEAGFFNLGAWAAVHGNGRTLEEIVEHGDWAEDHHLVWCMTEDRPPTQHSDMDNRIPAVLSLGARLISPLGIRRDVNADPINFPPLNIDNRWGVNPQGKKNRKRGAMWTCQWPPEDVPNPAELDRLDDALRALGVDPDPSLDLPWGSEEPPPSEDLPGWHQLAALLHLSNRMSGTNEIKADEHLQSLYRGWLDRTQ